MGPEGQRDVRFYTDNIRTFAAVAELGGVGRAARSLGLSQPAVSQQVARLEGLLGRRLFERGKAGVVLTPDGALLFRHARTLIAVSETIGRSFGLGGGTVRLAIGMTEMFCLTSLRSILWHVAKHNPGLALRIVSGRTEQLGKGFEAGEFDVLVSGPVAAPPVARFLRSEDLVWIGRPDAPQPVPDPIPLVLPVAPSRLRAAMVEAVERAGRSWVSTFEASSVPVAEAAIDAGFGFCAAMASMPLRGAVRLGARSGLPDLPGLDHHVHRRAGRDDAVVAAFCDLIAESVQGAD